MKSKRKSKVCSLILIALLSMLTYGCKKDKEKEIEYGTVSDIDGNSYKTVKIGTQEWMAENLRTTKYRNGDTIPNAASDSIPQANSDTAWMNLTTGVYFTAPCCVGDWTFVPEDVITYGRLYDWYAVNDSRNIAPEGWHVPTDEDWTILVDYLGGDSVAGGKMKEEGTLHWESPNANATNESGFTARGAGYFGEYLGFVMIGFVMTECCWWSSAEYDSMCAWSREVCNCNYQNTIYGTYGGRIYRFGQAKYFGLSVRCVKD